MNLTKEKKEIIRKVLERRIKLSEENELLRLSELQLVNFKSILNKLDNEKCKLIKNEVVCLFYLKKYLDKQFELKFPHESPLFWLNETDEFKELMHISDTLSEILSPQKKYISDNKYNLDFTYLKTYDNVNKLKKSETILLSKTNDPYKICFIYNLSEYMVFDLKFQFFFENMTFLKFNNYSDLLQEFDIEVNRKRAYDILSDYYSADKSTKHIDFIKEVLK